MTDRHAPTDGPAPALAAFVLALLVALAACPKPALGPVDDCPPFAQECRADRPRVCSGSRRWQPAGDLRCTDVGAACVVTDGVAHCAPKPRDASAPDADDASTDGSADHE